MNLTSFLFSSANAITLPFWVLLIFLPKSRPTQWLFGSSRPIPLLVLALFYAAAVIPALISSPHALEALARPTLEGVRSLLGSEAGAAAGWIHYLCFDLFVGVSIWKAACQRRQSFLWVGPILALVLMLGPLGWLSYGIVSRLQRKDQR